MFAAGVPLIEVRKPLLALERRLLRLARLMVAKEQLLCMGAPVASDSADRSWLGFRGRQSHRRECVGPSLEASLGGVTFAPSSAAVVGLAIARIIAPREPIDRCTGPVHDHALGRRGKTVLFETVSRPMPTSLVPPQGEAGSI